MLAAALSPAELDELAALLDDNALARLTLAAVRQIRRRLSRGRRGEAPSPAMRRILQQLVVELGSGSGE